MRIVYFVSSCKKGSRRGVNFTYLFHRVLLNIRLNATGHHRHSPRIEVFFALLFTSAF